MTVFVARLIDRLNASSQGMRNERSQARNRWEPGRWLSHKAEEQAHTAKHRKKHPTPGDVLVIIGIAALMGLAIREQLQMPKDQRTWRGTLFNIPYDFRWPTTQRLRETFWNKETARVLVPQFFGMGWSINFYPLINPPSAERLLETPAAK